MHGALIARPTECKSLVRTAVCLHRTEDEMPDVERVERTVFVSSATASASATATGDGRETSCGAG